MFRVRREVYLDNNATTKVAAPVRRRMSRVLRRCYGNPSSLYRVARNSAAVLEEARGQVARAVGAEPQEILFTGSATEANNMILKGLADVFQGRKGRIVASPIEHASVLSTLEHLKGQGVAVDLCPVDRWGKVRLEALEGLVDDETCLVCVMLANNEVGTIQDVARVAALARSRGALVLSDCVQALGKIPVDVKALGVDYASFSAHKIHGPKGVGALYVREGCPIVPLVHGGHQEGGLRAGTESVHSIAGFGAGCSAVENMLQAAPKVRRRKERVEAGLRALKPDLAIRSPEESCLPNTLSVTLPGVSNAVLVAVLDSFGIAVSAGSACNTQADEPSHVLTALGLTPEEARQTVRISLSLETSDRDVGYFLRIVGDYLRGRTPPIGMVTPTQLDEDLLLDEGIFLLDVRFWHDRKILRGLPNSYEASLFALKRYLSRVPKDRHVLVVCQMGYNSPIAAYYLWSRGYRRVSFLATGLLGWRVRRPDLYEKLAGRNITRLEPGR